MSSYPRRLQRRRMRERDGYEAPPQPVIYRETGYLVLHPTKGWKTISYRRYAAQMRMAQILERNA